MARYSKIVKEKDFEIKRLNACVSERDGKIKEAIEIMGRLYDALVEMPQLSSLTKDLLGETDDFIKQYD